MKKRLFLSVVCLALALTVVSHYGKASAFRDDHIQLGAVERNCGPEPCDAVARGAHAFFDHKLHGLNSNGRSCADCHMVSDSFQLSPANAELRYQQLQARLQWDRHADDPLFRPIDADD